MGWKEFLKSKKAKGFLIGLVALVSSQLLGLPENVVNGIVALVATYIGAQGVADGLSKGATSSSIPKE